MRRLSLLILVLIAALAGCATIPRYEAAGDIHAFLVSIRDGDRRLSTPTWTSRR